MDKDQQLASKVDALLGKHQRREETSGSGIPVLTEVVNEPLTPSDPHPMGSTQSTATLPRLADRVLEQLSQQIFNKVFTKLEGELAERIENRLTERLAAQVGPVVAHVLTDLRQEVANEIGDAIDAALAEQFHNQ